MDFRKTISFDADPAAVYAMLCDPAFRAQVAQAADPEGAGSYEVDVVPATDGSGGATATLDLHLPTTGMPGAVRKAVGGEIHVEQEERWTSPVLATMTVTMPGKPGQVRGTITLTEVDGGRTEQTLDADVKVGIPLVGGRVEKLIGQILGNILKTQQTEGTRWLASR